MNLLTEKKLTVKQASSMSGISRSKLYELASSGKIGHFRIGGTILIPESSLNEFLKKHYHGKNQERKF